MILAHVNEQPLSVMKKAGFLSRLGDGNVLPDIDTALMRAAEITGA